MPTGPSGARFSTGMMISAHPELNVPLTPLRLLSCAYTCAFAQHCQQWPSAHYPSSVASTGLRRTRQGPEPRSRKYRGIPWANASHNRRYSGQAPKWRNWQTRRTQNPVPREGRVGSTPTFGTCRTISPVAYDEQLAERIRQLVAKERGITEQRMFGGLAFLLNG